MLTINEAQLSNIADSLFEQKFVRFLHEQAPDSIGAIETPEGRAILRDQIASARRYGFNSEADLSTYILTAWLMGPDFNVRFPAMTEVLESKSLSPSEKAEALSQISTMVLGELADGRIQN